MTLKNNRAPLLSNIKLCASFQHHIWIQTGVMVRKQLSCVLISVTFTFDLWPWPFVWTLCWALVITPENFMMIQSCEHSEKGVTDTRTDRKYHRAAWSQLKMWSGMNILKITYVITFSDAVMLIFDPWPWKVNQLGALPLPCVFFFYVILLTPFIIWQMAPK